MNGRSQAPATLALFPPVTSEYHINQLQIFLVTVLYIENDLVSRLIHCLLLEKNWETECIYVIRKKDGKLFSAGPVTEIRSK